MNGSALQALTLLGLIQKNPVLDPLAALHLNIELYL